MLDYVGLIPLFPAIGFALNLFFGRRLAKGTVGLIACGAIGLSFLVSLLVFVDLLNLPPANRSVEKILYTWILSGEFQAKVGFLVDPLSMVMMMVVSGVSFVIHIYSHGYMHDDPDYPRYFTYLNLFVFFMLILVSANNFLLLFVGWEGVGLCSYFLIGFWYEKKSASDAGKKAFIVNRIGDYGFLLAIFLIFVTFGTIDFKAVFAAAPEKLALGEGMVTLIALLLFMGATGKSAQIPLYTWLPDAMEGPTPVSALIHAATMVTAGVYMVARCHLLFLMAPTALLVVAVIGAADRHLRRFHRPGPERYQTGSGLLHDQPARIHVFRLRRRRLYRRDLPPDDPRLLQSPALFRRGQRDARHGRRARHAQDGRSQAAPAPHLLDVSDRHPGPRRDFSLLPAFSPRMRSSGRL